MSSYARKFDYSIMYKKHGSVYTCETDHFLGYQQLTITVKHKQQSYNTKQTVLRERKPPPRRLTSTESDIGFEYECPY